MMYPVQLSASRDILVLVEVLMVVRIRLGIAKEELLGAAHIDRGWEGDWEDQILRRRPLALAEKAVDLTELYSCSAGVMEEDLTELCTGLASCLKLVLLCLCRQVWS